MMGRAERGGAGHPIAVEQLQQGSPPSPATKKHVPHQHLSLPHPPQIPKTVSEPELTAVFTPFGEVDQVSILKSRGIHAGCAFVQYKSWSSCEKAIEALHEKMVMPGCEHALVVKFADAKRTDSMPMGAGPRVRASMHTLREAVGWEGMVHL
jgi:hypothetical protein